MGVSGVKLTWRKHEIHIRIHKSYKDDDYKDKISLSEALPDIAKGNINIQVIDKQW